MEWIKNQSFLIVFNEVVNLDKDRDHYSSLLIELYQRVCSIIDYCFSIIQSSCLHYVIFAFLS